MTPRARRRLAWLLAVVAVLVAAPLGVLRWVRSASGNAFLKQKALAAVGEALAGKVELGVFSLEGETLHLEHLTLFTPEGELVVELDSVDAHVRLSALARHQVTLDHLTITGARATLVRDERGLNLLRALAGKGPPAATAPAWAVDLDRVSLTGAQVDYRDAAGVAEHLTNLSVSGAAHLGLATGALEGDLKLTAEAAGVAQGPLELTASVATVKHELSAETRLRVGASSAHAKWNGAKRELALDEVVAHPELVRGLLPTWPLKVPLAVSGEASATRAQLRLKAGQSTATVDAAFVLEPSLGLSAFTVQAVDVDLQALVGAERSSTLSFTAKGGLPDSREASVTGEIELEASARAVDSVVTLKAHAKAAAGVGRVESLLLSAPGLSLAAQGRLSPRHLAMSGTLTAADLSQLPATVQRFTGVELPSLAGSGSLSVDVLGPLAHPGITATGTLHGLRVDGVTADVVAVDAQLPDVRAPLDTDATVHANQVTVAARSFEQVDFTLATHQRDLEVDLSTKGLGDTHLHIGGTVDARGLGAQLASFTVTSSTSAWALEAPTHVGWGDQRLQLGPLTLRDGAQSLTMVASRERSAVRGSFSAVGVDLARLPKALSLESLGLAGTLSADATLEGTVAKPVVRGAARVSQGAALGVTGLEVSTDVGWSDEVLRGTVTLDSPAGSGQGRFELPLLTDETTAPVSANIALRQVDLAAVRAPLVGRADLDLDVRGTTSTPVITATVSAPAVTASLEGHAIAFAATTARLQTDGGPLQLQAHTEALGGVADLELTTPLTIASLRAPWPAPREVPLTGSIRLEGLDAHQLEALELTEQRLAGRLGLTATFAGTLDAPTGEVTLIAEHLEAGPVVQVDGAITARARAHETTLDASISHLGKQLLSLQASIAAPVRQLVQRDALGPQALTGSATLFPVELSTVLRMADGQPTPHGVASATFTATGTLEAPQVRLAGSVQTLKVDKVNVGSARFELTGTAASQQLTLALGGTGASDLKVKGTLGLPLSPTARDRSWSLAPLHLTLDSRALDLAFLSGLSSTVRLVGGALTMHAEVEGTLGDPQGTGEAHWAGGRLALYGFGDYRDIRLDATASNSRLKVTTLEVKSGAGSATAALQADRVSPSLWRFEGTGSTDKFPLVTDDQLVATASLTASFAGELTDSLLDLTTLSVPRVDVELPDVKRKDLQDLQRPKDIVVLRGGASRKRRPATGATPVSTGRGVRAFIDAPRNLWVRSSDLNLELGLSEAFRVETGAVTQVFGEATIVRGDLNVIGREFVVQKGSQVRFAGPAVQPTVNVTAVHTNEKEKVKVTVTVVGRGTDVTLKATSEPSMPESDIYTLLATGRLKLQRGSGASITPEDAVSVVGQLAASQLKTALAKKLPIDVLNFEAADNFQRIKFDVGKYLSDRLYLGFSAQTGANVARGENPWAGRLEFQMSRSVSLEVFAGTAPAAGGDVVWSRDF